MTALAERAPLRPTRGAATAVVAAAAIAGCVAVLGTSALDVLSAGVVGLLIWLAAIDLEFRLVPNRIVLPATAVVLLVAAAIAPDQALERGLAAAGAGAFLLVAALIRPGDLGMGDVKLALLLGATLGAAVVTALVVGFGLVALIGLALALKSGRQALKGRLPLVPFLVLGAIVALVAG
jgi:leader peptidase (prepilin peptidase)/N-methyltransferase